MSGGIGDAGWWLIAAALLAMAELVVPGVFLAFFAIAAAITGALALLFPGLGIIGELIAFSAWSIVCVVIGKRWYDEGRVGSADPMLNDRAARMLGEPALVVEAIAGGRGRVRIGDGEWPASGPDLPFGTRARVVAVEDGVVRVEASGGTVLTAPQPDAPLNPS